MIKVEGLFTTLQSKMNETEFGYVEQMPLIFRDVASEVVDSLSGFDLSKTFSQNMAMVGKVMPTEEANEAKAAFEELQKNLKNLKLNL